jgi:hypothetical protein
MDPKLLDALSSPGGALAFLVLIAPGFVALRTMEMLISSERRKAADAIIDIVLFSVVTDTIWGFLLSFAHVRSLTQVPLGVQVALLVLIVFVTPVALTMLYVRVRRWLTERRGGIDLEAKPWDLAFHRYFANDPVQIVLTLAGGRKIGGFYQKPSAASGFPVPEQLYIKDVYSVDETSGRLIGRIENHRGLLVDKSSVETIEFFDFARPYAEDSAAATEGAPCAAPECLSTWAILQRAFTRRSR